LPGFFVNNEKGFAMLGNLKNVRPEPKPNWKTADEDNNKKPTGSPVRLKLVCPNKCHIELQIGSARAAHCYSIRPNIAKPLVSGSLFRPSPKYFQI
jgi:hypothetical protein